MNNSGFQFIQHLEFNDYSNYISLNTMIIRNNVIYKPYRII